MDIRTAINLIEDAQTSNLARWFSGSKIVDDAGRPLKLYHGTSKDMDFKSFRMPKNGIWFTADSQSASDYAKDNDSKGVKYDDTTRTFRDVHTAARVIPVYVRATNPVFWDEWPAELNVDNYKRAQGILFDKLRWQGHDAIVYGTGSDRIVVVIGSPNQIKSAIGNRGAYDPAKKNIDEDEDPDHDLFSAGYCHAFALALHRRTDMPMVALWAREGRRWAIIHVMCEEDEHTFWDIGGSRGLHDILYDADIDPDETEIRVDPCSEADFKKWLRKGMVAITPEIMARADAAADRLLGEGGDAKLTEDAVPPQAPPSRPEPLRFREEMTGYSHGQSDQRLLALRGNEAVGYIDYSVWHDEVSIKFIKVAPAATRQGIARAMLKHLQGLHPETEIEWGMLTDDGSKLYDKIDFDTVIDPTMERKFARLAALRKKEEALQAEADAIWDKQVSPESRERLAALTDEWNAVNDEIHELERELQGRSASKRLIRREQP